jgi:predicted RNase H-like HicB family nuclease
MKITIELERAEDMTEETWASHCLETDAFSQGRTPKEALEAIAEAVDMIVTDEITALAGSGQIEKPGWERAFLNIACEKAAPGGPFPRTVTCVWCGNKYRSACPGDIDRGLQGSHCASDVVREGDQWIVRGGYGSDEHDLQRYVFVANPPTSPADPICDECISQRESAGDLVETTPECYRTGRLKDFSPRPPGTRDLVGQIRRLIEERVATRQLTEAAMKANDAGHPDLGDAVREYRRHQRWTGEIDDDGETYAEKAPEVAGQMRESARQLEEMAATWEQRGFGNEALGSLAEQQPQEQRRAADQQGGPEDPHRGA